jgi:hypothetical protein
MNLGSGPLASLRVTACRSDLSPSALRLPARPPILLTKLFLSMTLWHAMRGASL